MLLRNVLPSLRGKKGQGGRQRRGLCHVLRHHPFGSCSYAVEIGILKDSKPLSRRCEGVHSVCSEDGYELCDSFLTHTKPSFSLNLAVEKGRHTFAARPALSGLWTVPPPVAAARNLHRSVVTTIRPSRSKTAFPERCHGAARCLMSAARRQAALSTRMSPRQPFSTPCRRQAMVHLKVKFVGPTKKAAFSWHVIFVFTRLCAPSLFVCYCLFVCRKFQGDDGDNWTWLHTERVCSAGSCVRH